MLQMENKEPCKDFELQERKIMLQIEQQRNEGRITVLCNFQTSIAGKVSNDVKILSCEKEQQKIKTDCVT